ncbi:MAG: DUF1549 and DUF1553 domain-containing protein, partial [Gemmataceae bacterium]|nr:DUF1549 and DUF1553 domain-containing protein [Gemmataceae bacterium]
MTPANRHVCQVMAAALWAGFALVSSPAWGAESLEPEERAALIGQPSALEVWPSAINLRGPRAMQQVIVTGRYADGTVRDLTAFSDLVVADDVVCVQPGGFLTPRRNGRTELIVMAGTRTSRVPVTVVDADRPQPVSFRHEVIAALSIGACNSGACHGTPSGKNGFRLSLRGFDPAADYLQLTRDVLGRRTDPHHPEASLLYLKGLGRVPHEGGQRFAPTSLAAEVLRAWLSEGLRDDPPDLPALRRLEIVPGSRVLHSPARWQQLAVMAHFADGSSRDVTRLCVFSSSDAAVANVSPSGLVELRHSGEIAILCRYLDELQSVRLTYLQPRPGFVWPNPPEANYVDSHVFAKLKMLNISPSPLCTDAEFVRRAFLDVCGILPTPAEAEAFLTSSDANKRAKLIDALLERPEYADFWTLKWCDVLRSNRKTIQAKGTQVYQQWLRSHIARNTPFDQVVKELLTASGSTFANPPANYFRIARDPQNLAETTAQLFCGVRMQCARCHNHPFERWTQDDYYSLAAFFARVKQKKDVIDGGTLGQRDVGAEVIFSDRSGEVIQPRTGKVVPPKFMGGSLAEVPAGQDRRRVLADWLTSGDNPFFAKATVNRIWFHLMGRGIVDPVDDFRDSNPSANDELLDALAKDFVAHQFDVKHLVRTIMNSRT